MKKIIFAVMAAMLLAACEKEIPLKADQIDPMVVAVANVESGDSLSLRLTYSRPIFGWHDDSDNGGFEEIANATVSLKVNGAESGVTVDHIGGSYFLGYVPQEGDKLELSVRVPGHDEVTSETVVPHHPELSNLRTTFRQKNDYESEVEIRFNLRDNASSDDYYMMRVYVIDTFFSNYTDPDDVQVEDTLPSGPYIVWFACNDAAITSLSITDVDVEGNTNDDYDELYFNDININGENHEIFITAVVPAYAEGVPVRQYVEVEVVALARDRFLYEQTLEAARGYEGFDLFQEPVPVHCNINNGIGIFAGVSRSRMKAKVEM